MKIDFFVERIVEAYETGELKPSDQMNRPPSPFSPDTPDSSSVSGMGSPHMRMGGFLKEKFENCLEIFNHLSFYHLQSSLIWIFHFSSSPA